MPSLIPHLWFDKEADEAAALYCSIFPNSRIVARRDFGEIPPGSGDHVSTVTFELDGQMVIALNGGPHFEFNEAFSFFVECETQEEVDRYWTKLTADGGQEVQCGWLKDRFGLSWQIVPKILDDLLSSDDRAAADRAMQAMLQMKKIDIKKLEAAYAGDPVTT